MGFTTIYFKRYKNLTALKGGVLNPTANKRNGWLFDWKMEFSQHERQLFKLVTEKDQQIIHGLLSIEIMEDHVFMHLIESAPCNIGNEKHYLGVCGNLTAYGGKLSMDCGDQSQIRISLEAQAKLHIQRCVINKEYDLLYSYLQSNNFYF